MIGHELTALYGLDHAETLAVVMPGVWKFGFAHKQPKLEQYARRIWGREKAEDAAACTEEFFHSLGMGTHLGDYGIDADDAAKAVRERFEARGAVFGENEDIDGEAVAEILAGRR